MPNVSSEASTLRSRLGLLWRLGLDHVEPRDNIKYLIGVETEGDQTLRNLALLSVQTLDARDLFQILN